MTLPEYVQQNGQEVSWLLTEKYGWESAKATVFISRSDLGAIEAAEQGSLKADLERLVAGEPLAYVIGWVEFLGCKIFLERKVLIPRPETEFWVGKLIEEYRQRDEETKRDKDSRADMLEERQVLDLCCGSGCIGVSWMKHFPNDMVQFVDISPDAIRQTQDNLSRNGIGSFNARVQKSDLTEFLASGSMPQYDLILTNPPYVDLTGEFDESLQWEPAEALFAQDHGLSLIYQILELVPKKLKTGGELVLEFGKGQEAAIEEWLKKLELRSYSFGKDQFGVVRWVRVTV